MRVKNKGKLLVAGLILGLQMIVGGTTAMAATYCETDVNEEDIATGCTMLGIPGEYITDAENALARINEIRKEACDNGYPDPRDKTRQTKLKSSDYVPIQWSQSLEKIARIRAAEASMTRDHKRLNDKYIFDLKFGGITSGAEDLAWNNTTNVISGINQWYDEKQDWLDNTPGAVTGHYTSMINPSYKYIGLGCFLSDETYYRCCLAAELKSSCGSLGSEPLDAVPDAIQILEVKNSYFTNQIDSADEVRKGNQVQVGIKARVEYRANFETEVERLEGEFTYTSSNTENATITSDGLFTGVEEGVTTIYAKENGNTIASKEITVVCPHEYQYSPSVSQSRVSYTGICDLCGDKVTVRFSVNSSDNQSQGYLTWSDGIYNVGDSLYVRSTYQTTSKSVPSNEVVVTSSNSAVVSTGECSSSNVTPLTFQETGIVHINVEPQGDPQLAKTYTLRVKGENTVDIANAEAVLDVDSFIYTKKEHKPIPTVTYDDITLKEGTDYTVTYEDNVEDGIGTVVITGTGIFSGEKRVHFIIEKEKITDEDVSLTQDTFTFCGEEIKPELTVTHNGKTLVEDTDYTVNYEWNYNAGTANIIVDGIDLYGGVVDKTFTIEPLDISDASVNAACEEDVYDGEEHTPKVNVQHKKIDLSEHIGYEVEFEPATEAGIYEVALNGVGNYTGSISIDWVIQKAVPEFDVPSAEASCGMHLYDVELPEGFVWASKNKVLSYEEDQNALALYTPEDTKNYKSVDDVEIPLMISHTWDEGEVTTLPTCSKMGVTTYTCVMKDGTNEEEDVDYDPDNHNFVNGVCSDCAEIWQTVVDGVTYKALIESVDGVIVGQMVGDAEDPENRKLAVCVVEVQSAEERFVVESEKTVDNVNFVVTEIGEGAFENADVKEVELPATIVHVGVDALKGVESVMLLGSNAPEGIVDALSENVTVNVPEEYAQDYKETLGDAVTVVEKHVTHVKDQGTTVEATYESEGSITYKCEKCGQLMDVVVIPKKEKTQEDPDDENGSGESGQNPGGDTGSGDAGQTPGGNTGSGDAGQTSGGNTGSGDEGQTPGGDNGSGDAGQTPGGNTGSGDAGQTLGGNASSGNTTQNPGNDTGSGSTTQNPGNTTGGTTTTVKPVSKINIATCLIGRPKTIYFYTGNAIQPPVSVQLKDKTLVEGVDYIVSYSNNVNVGMATVTVTGIGKYTGTSQYTFGINPAAVSIKKLTAKKGKLTIKWKANAKQGASYKIQYATKKSFKGKKTINVKSAKTASKSVKKLKRGKTYYVRICTYKTVGGQTYVSPWSKVARVKMK